VSSFIHRKNTLEFCIKSAPQKVSFRYPRLPRIAPQSVHKNTTPKHQFPQKPL